MECIRCLGVAPVSCNRLPRWAFNGFHVGFADERRVDESGRVIAEVASRLKNSSSPVQSGFHLR
jgi:hypothetical protein